MRKESKVSVFPKRCQNCLHYACQKQAVGGMKIIKYAQFPQKNL